MAAHLSSLKILLSWLCVAFGQPAASEPLSILASALGYALFWSALAETRRPFWVAVVWFLTIQMVQIRWLASDVYMGLGIYAVYGLLCLALGLQFGALSSLIRLPLKIPAALGLSGFWVAMEWLRTLPLTGFTWNPVGLSLATGASIQFASLLGIYGLSFWVIWVNLLALQRKWALWGACALFPYLFGALHIAYWESNSAPGSALSVALVQTAILPEEKDYSRASPKSYIQPVEQWSRIIATLKESGKSRYDLIVLPEGALPWAMRKMGYPFEAMKEAWISHFGPDSVADFPPQVAPFGNGQKVSNAFWAQSLANHFHAEFVVGLLDAENGAVFNSAFYFRPRMDKWTRYDKRVLVPVGEYVPLSDWKFLSDFVTDRFDVGASFVPGSEAKVLFGPHALGVSICSEEVYGYLAREARLAGAEVFINISNDGWFPDTPLPDQHFLHGKIRAVENGVGLMRSCNSGITGAVDSFGREISIFDQKKGVLTFEMPVRSHPTLYTFWGDAPILFSSFSFAAALLFFRFRKKKLP